MSEENQLNMLVSGGRYVMWRTGCLHTELYEQNGNSRSRKWLHHCESASGLFCTRETLTYWSKWSRELSRQLGHKSAWCARKGWRGIRGDVIPLLLPTWGLRRRWSWMLSELHNDSHKLQQEEFWDLREKIFTAGVVKCWNGLPSEVL